MANPSIDFEKERINLKNSNRRSLDSIIDLKQSRDAVAGNYSKELRDRLALREKYDSMSISEFYNELAEAENHFLQRYNDILSDPNLSQEEKQKLIDNNNKNYDAVMDELGDIEIYINKNPKERKAEIEQIQNDFNETIHKDREEKTKKIKHAIEVRVSLLNLYLTKRKYPQEEIYEAYKEFAEYEWDKSFQNEFYIMVNEALNLESNKALHDVVESLSRHNENKDYLAEARTLVEEGIAEDDPKALYDATKNLRILPPSQDKEDLYRAIGKKLEQLLEKYKAEKNLEGLNSLIPAIKGLPDGSDRKRDLLEELPLAISEVEKALEEEKNKEDDSKDDEEKDEEKDEEEKDNDITQEQYDEIMALLEKAAKENDIEALKLAIAKIDDLPDCDKKQELTDRMNVIRKHIIDYYLEQTKESKDMWDLSQAKKAVNTMSEGPDKEDYKRKIAELEEMIKTWKPKLSWKTGLAIAAGGLVGGLAGHFLPGIGKIAVVAAGSIGTAIAKKNRNKAKAERLSGTKKVVNVKEPKTKLGEKLIQLKNYLSQEEQLRDIQYGLTAMAAAAGIAGAIQTIRQLVGGNAAAVSGPGTTEQDPGITPTDDSIPDVLPTETVIPDVEMPDLNNIDLTGISQGYIDSEGNGLTSLITEAGKHAKFDRVVNGMAHFKQANGKGFAWIPVESLPEKVQEAIQATIEMGGRSL